MRVTGAVSGLMMGSDGGSVDGKCVPANASAVAAPTVDGIHNYTCTFNNAGEVPRSIIFLARTPALGEQVPILLQCTSCHRKAQGRQLLGTAHICSGHVPGRVLFLGSCGRCPAACICWQQLPT